MKTPATFRFGQLDIDVGAYGSQGAQHDAYQARFEAMVAAVAAMDERARRYALGRLAHLGAQGCRSGTMEFANTAAALERIGLAQPNYIFECDRDEICEHFGAGITEDDRRVA